MEILSATNSLPPPIKTPISYSVRESQALTAVDQLNSSTCTNSCWSILIQPFLKLFRWLASFLSYRGRSAALPQNPPVPPVRRQPFTRQLSYHEDSSECTICLSSLTMPIELRPCGHVYDLFCIYVWKSKQSQWTCPQCIHVVDGIKHLPDRLDEKVELVIKDYSNHTLNVTVSPLVLIRNVKIAAFYHFFHGSKEIPSKIDRKYALTNHNGHAYLGPFSLIDPQNGLETGKCYDFILTVKLNGSSCDACFKNKLPSCTHPESNSE